jgi:hypothetical protein
MTDWRDPRPIHKDPRLTDVSGLVRHYRNLWMEADFNDEPMAKEYERRYRHYQQLEKSGVYYEPLF